MYRGILMICITLVLSSASMATDWTVESETLPAGLQAAIDAFYTAIDSDDVETRIGLLADNVVMMPNHWTMVSGKDAVAAGFRESAGSVFRLRDRVTDFLNMLKLDIRWGIVNIIGPKDNTTQTQG
jgi:hypothetical protein